jgi:putative MFS transporter
MSDGTHAGKTEPAPKASAYHRQLLLFLSVASFFEGYDFYALSQLLPNLCAYFHVSQAHSGRIYGFINCGTILAFFLARRADRWGRKPVLTLTIAGYTFFTFCSGLAPDVYVFCLLQMIARIFLIAEWATSMVIAAEEFPANGRGTMLGVVSAASGFGAIVCAGLVPLLLKTPFGWRSVYFVSLVPLLTLAYARRGLRETERFLNREIQGDTKSLFEIWKTKHRRRVIEMAAVWFLTYICTQNAVSFWKQFAVTERGMSDSQVAKAIEIGALASMPLAFATGKLLDVIGRKPGATLIFASTIVGVVGAYTAHESLYLTLFLVLAMLGVNTVLTVLNAFTAELFPTEHRGAAFAWSNNLIGRIGYCVSPIVLSELSVTYHWGPTIAATAVFPLLALAVIWVLLPETSRRELEETAQL